MRARQQQYTMRSTGTIHVPMRVYVFTSSQTPFSSPPDEEHGMFGNQAAYTAATPMWQVSNVSILTASSHDLNRSSNMTGSNITVNKLVKSSTTMNVSGRELWDAFTAAGRGCTNVLGEKRV